MRPDHVLAFKTVADRFTCWIGLREPNPLGEKWIGNAACMPKPETCKAKTADNPGFPQAGLVVDPSTRPEAFLPASRPEALRKWTMEFAKGGRLPTGYTTVTRGPEQGLVKLRGKSLYADFDLMALLRSDASGAKLHTSQGEQAQLFAQVAPALNQLLRVELIQHGAEFMWLGGVGARESEWVLWFGPGGRLERHASSMPRGGH
jgi:hypothetical protein